MTNTQTLIFVPTYNERGNVKKLCLELLDLNLQADILFLDEPTNHLDIRSREALEDALKAFPGTVVVVSHDRFFVDKVATRLLVFEGGSTQPRFVSGNWSTWQASNESS